MRIGLSATGGGQESPERQRSRVELLKVVEDLIRQLKISDIFREELVARANAQLSAIFHLIAQEDTQVSIRLAESSTSLAAESKRLAEVASRDAKAMKTLAVVTMVYLPPTTIATIYAMPFFNWKLSVDGLVSRQFWIYWVTAIPLTLITLFVWWLWIRRDEDIGVLLRRFDGRDRQSTAREKGGDYGRPVVNNIVHPTNTTPDAV